MRVLAEHGVSAEAAAAIQALGERMREMSRVARVEAAAMVEASTGEQLGEILPGGRYGVSITRHLDATKKRVGETFVQIHTHIDSTSFSEDDAAILTRYRKVVSVVVSALDGTWYVLSKERPASAGAVRSARVVRRFLQVYDDLFPVYQEHVRRGEMTEAEAMRAHPHEVWLRIRAELALRYDRVEAPAAESAGAD